MIKIKQGDTQIEIMGDNLEGKQSLLVSIDGREIKFSSVLEDDEDIQEKQEVEPEPEPEPPEPKKKTAKKETRGKSKQYTDERLFEDLLLKCFKLDRLPKSIEIQDDNNMASSYTYNSRLGSLSNVYDKLGYKLKNNKINEKMRVIVVDFCKKHNVKPSGKNMWEILIKNQVEYRENHPRGAKLATQISK